ncbi:MAG: class I SAM-dependent methyltransferase [Candidatus Roizmanbacteria bacterium]
MRNLLTIDAIISQEIDPAFADRARAIANAVSQKSPKRILDAGCGRGFYPKLLSYFDFPIKIIGIDISKRYVKKAKSLTKNDSRVLIRQGSIYKTGLPSKSIDCIICSEVLEHLDDPSAALVEFSRLLKPKGILLISVPHDNFPFFWDPLNFLLMNLFNTHVSKDIWWLAGIWADHERLYSEDMVKDLLKTNFTIKKIDRIVSTCWPFTHFFLYAIGKNIVEKLGGKDFDRFNFTEKPLSQFLTWFMRLPTKLKKDIKPTDRYMDMFVLAEKKGR